MILESAPESAGITPDIVHVVWSTDMVQSDPGFMSIHTYVRSVHAKTSNLNQMSPNAHDLWHSTSGGVHLDSRVHWYHHLTCGNLCQARRGHLSHHR